MAVITRSDLVNRRIYEYSWTKINGETPRTVGNIDSGQINKVEGYEVVDFINAYATQHAIYGLSSAYRIEDLIHACERGTREEIAQFINAHW